MTNDQRDYLAEKLYEYGKLRQELLPADAIVALGNMDVRVAEKAAHLWHERLAPVVVASGGIGRLTPKNWNTTEAAKFAEVLDASGLPKEAVIIEDKSTNLPENIRFSINGLEATGKPARRLILVALPFAERRMLGLCKKQFADVDVTMASPDVPYSQFPSDFISKDEAINLIVGELDRLAKFPGKGFSVPEEVPRPILEATASLINDGYDKYQVL